DPPQRVGIGGVDARQNFQLVQALLPLGRQLPANYGGIEQRQGIAEPIALAPDRMDFESEVGNFANGLPDGSLGNAKAQTEFIAGVKPAVSQCSYQLGGGKSHRNVPEIRRSKVA